MHPKDLQIQSFTYELPDERIAQFPLEQRDASNLLVRQTDGTILDATFSDLPKHLPAGGLLIFNETKVIRARLISPRGEGMRPIEIFCLDPINKDIESSMSAIGEVEYACLVGNAKKWKNGPLTWLDQDGNELLAAELIGRENGTFQVRFTWTHNMHFAAVLEELGHIPLPPYMHRPDGDNDVERYQTVYATRDGSVAAPTAGLHFTEKVLSDIESTGTLLQRVVLHVGAGTFKPVSSDTMEDHEMHSEAFEVTREVIQNIIQNPEVTAVGTTSTRTLESLYWIGVHLLEGIQFDLQNIHIGQWDPYETTSTPSSKAALEAIVDVMDREGVSIIRGRTQIIIAPGYSFKLVKRLITNFHQPGSTLILLVAAAIGENWKEVYNHAQNNDYRFLSYGDSSLLHIS